jgi:hypothetical protein
MKAIQYIWIGIILLIIPGCGSTQQVIPLKEKGEYVVLEKIVDIHVDNLQNIYILNNENKVVKYTESFEKQYEYSNNLIGEIKSIDATNPQKILCFIHGFNRIIMLDNTLSEINTIDLSNSEYLDVSVVARSNDNQIWLFDPINQVLVKVNDLIEKQYESNRLSDLNLGMIEPVAIIEKGNIVAMSDPKVGILIFDNFGQFLKLIPEKGISDFQIFGDYLFFTQNEKYYQYHIKRYEKSEFPNMIGGYSQFIVTKNITYFIDERGVVVLKK